METSQFSNSQPLYEGMERVDTQGATCDTFRVKLYGKLHFLKRLKSEYSGDVRYREALRKEFETGYRLEHPNLVRYVSMSDDDILMEYIDGETLSQRLATQPDYFRHRKNTDKFLRQILDVVSYLHSHQVLHLDLKPDNILLTRIGSDVKLIDLGYCYTDTFPDTTGHTNAFASPEQLSGGTVDARSDIYAIGRILEQLPNHTIYNKVIARCTAANPNDRYQSVEEIVKALSSRWKPYRAVLVIVLVLIATALYFILLGNHNDVVQVIEEKAKDTSTVVIPVAPQEQVTHPSVVSPVPASRQSPAKSSVPALQDGKQQMEKSSTPAPMEETQLLEKELDQLMDAAYRSTIATFCDSVFPSLTVGRQWEKASSEYHALSLQVVADMSKKYPDIPESVIIQHVESRFQSLTGYVFNRMRENGLERK